MVARLASRLARFAAAGLCLAAASAHAAAWEEISYGAAFTASEPMHFVACLGTEPATVMPNSRDCFEPWTLGTEETVACMGAEGDTPRCYVQAVSLNDGVLPGPDGETGTPGGPTQAAIAADMFELWGIGLGFCAVLAAFRLAWTRTVTGNQ